MYIFALYNLQKNCSGNSESMEAYYKRRHKKISNLINGKKQAWIIAYSYHCIGPTDVLKFLKKCQMCRWLMEAQSLTCLPWPLPSRELTTGSASESSYQWFVYSIHTVIFSKYLALFGLGLPMEWPKLLYWGWPKAWQPTWSTGGSE